MGRPRGGLACITFIRNPLQDSAQVRPDRRHTRDSTPTRLIFITGVSSGLGSAFADEALRRGHTVVGPVRSNEAAEQLEGRNGHAAAKMVDLTDETAVFDAVRQVAADLGPIDALIANAGFGFEGLFEESSMTDLQRQFEVNAFGTVRTIKAVLPGMRARRRGRILGITSVGGLTTSPGLSFYHGSEFALEGILEALGKEIRPLGIQVTGVEPGPFRTDWSGRSMSHAERLIADYAATYEPIRAARAAANGRQPGDPARAAAAVPDIVEIDDAPAHLLLGSAAVAAVDGARAAFDRDRVRFEALTLSTDFTPER